MGDKAEMKRSSEVQVDIHVLVDRDKQPAASIRIFAKIFCSLILFVHIICLKNSYDI